MTMRMGLSLLVSSAVLAGPLAAGGSAARVRPRSSGPVVTSATTAPWSVRILAVDKATDFDYTCSGSILDSTHILTAGHCVFDESAGEAEFPASAITVYAGTANSASTSTQQTSGVSAIRVGPGYTGGAATTVPDDVSELTLSTPLRFDAEVAPIAVAGSGQGVAAGTSAGNFAWGSIDPAGDYDGLEHSLAFTVDQPWTCIGARSNTLCAGSAQGDSCPGDSGSGLIVDTPTPTLVAVTDDALTAAEGGCTSGHETVYTDMSSPQMAAWLAGSASPPVPASVAAGYAAIYPGTEQVGSTMTCAPPTFANATSASYLFIDSANDVLQSGGPSYVVGAAELGAEIGCVAVGSGPGGSTYAESGFSGAIQPQSSPGLALSVSRTGRVHGSNAADPGLVMTVTATARGASAPAYTRTFGAATTISAALGRLLPGRYVVCLTSASQATYAAGQQCANWRHNGPALRFVSLHGVRRHGHPAVALSTLAPLRGARATIVWKGTRGHRTVSVHRRIRLRARTVLRPPRVRGVRFHTLRITLAGRGALGVRLSGGHATVRLPH